MSPRLMGFLLGALLVVAAVAAVPRVAPAYTVSLLLLVFMYVALTVSWNIVSGYTGYVSFGHVAFFGVGAYTAALLITRSNAAWPLAALAGGVLAMVVAVPIGLVTLRLKGPYFAVATLGLVEVFQITATAWEPVTRGGKGIYLPPILDISAVYYAMALAALVAIALNFMVATSRFGLRLLTIREDEIAAEAMGINTTREKLLAFVLSTFLPGVVGGVYAWYVSYIDPDSVFSASVTIRIMAMAMVGGVGTVTGPVIGAALLSLVGEFLWARFLFLHQAFLGVAVILVVLFMPGGLMEVLRDRGIVPRTRAY
ncbi:MAG: branched-chain amino acid ABC transporter permease [Chloroflexi bacterium]|nr:branched-chain amino acid ABC transporter permease [Chloroflexota bacterium]